MYDYIQISKINDFLFCPYSIYLHSVYGSFNQRVYHSHFQLRGKICHQPIDEGKYTTSKNILQGMEVYSEKYNLIGKIDIFDIKNGLLIERKYRIKKIYDGYKMQLYAQMFCLLEMGYEVKELRLYSLADNKRYKISMPSKDEVNKFEKLIDKILNYRVEKQNQKNLNKCGSCIYKPLCHQ